MIEDARARQRRHRRAAAAAWLVIALAALVYLDAGGGRGGGRHPPPGVTTSGASPHSATNLRMPRGPVSSTIVIHAPAGHAYDVTIKAPAQAAVVLRTSFGWPGPSFRTRGDPQNCRTAGGSTTCLIHFAAGGNAGGTWRWTLTKTSTPAALVQLTVAFNRHLGDYRG